MPSRRGLLGGGLLLAGALLVQGHTPYRQWVVYRKKHLLIGCHREDPRSYQLARLVVAILETELPEARARIARAPTAGRLASLLGTDQLELSILDAATAAAMLAGDGAFAPYGAVALRLVLPLRDRLLVGRADFPERHAWLVSHALAGTLAAAQPNPEALDEAMPPWHPGSLEFVRGEPEPAAP